MASRNQKRRGRDARTSARVSATGWTTADTARVESYVEASPIADDTMRRAYAQSAVELDVQIRGLMALAVRNADEEGALVQAQKTRLAVLSRLKLDEEADEEGDEDDDDEK